MTTNDDGQMNISTNTSAMKDMSGSSAANVNATSSPTEDVFSAADSRVGHSTHGASLNSSSYGGVDLFSDFSQPVTSPYKPVPVGNSVDLLGDEIVTPEAVVVEPEQPSEQGAQAASNDDAACTADAAAESPTLATQEPSDQLGGVACTPGEEGESPEDKGGSPEDAGENTAAVTSPGDNQGHGRDEAFSVPIDSENDSGNNPPGHENSGRSQSLPSEHEQGADDDPTADDSDGPGGQGSDGDGRIVDSDREVVEEEDAFGDFADFTTASHFLPGGGLGAATAGQPPPPSASAAAAARAAGANASTSSSPSAHRHAHLGASVRPTHGMLFGGGPQLHASSVSGALSEHGSFGGDYSDFSHPSPPPSIAPSRAGGGRKSVASIASVGSRAGGDDDVGDYGSVVGSSVWRAPSQMATSSYAAAAGADDDFGDFTSDITSTSDFAPSTQPPSAVAVSGPGSVHPDDDFGSFASHRSTADDDEDDFGNFNAAPAGAGGAGGAGPSGSGAGAGGSGSGAAAAGSAAAAGAAGASSTVAISSGFGPGSATHAPSWSPREAAAGGAGAHLYHSTQTVGPAASGAGSAAEAAVEPPLLQLPSAELRQAVARALQPLLPGGSPLGPAHLRPAIPDEQVSAAWAQLRRHVQAARGDGSIEAHNGMPLPSAADGGGMPDGVPGRGVYTPAVKFTRPLRWKGSDSERRLLVGLGLSELAAQARILEAVEGPRMAGRGRSDTALSGSGIRQLGMLASFGDAPRRTRVDSSTISAGLHRDTECDTAAGGGSSGAGGGGASRARGLDQNGEGGWSAGSLLDLGAGAGAGATPRQAGGINGYSGQQQHGNGGVETANGLA